MNYSRKNKLFPLVLLLVSLITISTSCQKDKDEDPAFVGIWVATENIPAESGYVQVQEQITLTTNSFVDVAKVYNSSTSKWIDYISLSGSMSVSENQMNLTVKEIGMSTFDMMTGYPTGTMTKYKEGSTEFDALLDETGQPKSFSSIFSVSGNQLTIKTDQNEDGDYTDEGETTVYSKQ